MPIPNEYYSLLIDILDKKVLVIGQYRILEFKIQKLIDAGAKITYLSDTLSDNLKQHVESGQLSYSNEQFTEKHLDDTWLVICGIDDDEVKNRIQKATEERHIFCNFVDEPIPSSFISPSVIKKGDITISISTKGKSPSLNRFLKKKINDFVGDEYVIFAELLGEIRQRVLDTVPNQKNRAKIFDSIVHKNKIWKLVKSGKRAKAKSIIDKIVDKALDKE